MISWEKVLRAVRLAKTERRDISMEDIEKLLEEAGNYIYNPCSLYYVIDSVVKENWVHYKYTSAKLLIRCLEECSAEGFCNLTEVSDTMIQYLQDAVRRMRHCGHEVALIDLVHWMKSSRATSEMMFRVFNQ